MNSNKIEKANKRFKILSRLLSIQGKFSREIYPDDCLEDPDGYYNGTYEISCQEGYWAECYLHSFWHVKWWIKFLRNPNENWEYREMSKVDKVHKLKTYQHSQEYMDHFW